jgi:hypothetical protein
VIDPIDRDQDHSKEARVKLAILFLVLGLAITGCASNADLGGGSGNGDASVDTGGGGSFDGSIPDGPSSFQDAAPIPLGDLCPLYTEDLCIYLMQCNRWPFQNMSQCLAENTCYGLPNLTAAASRGDVLYDPSAVGACDARFRSDPCSFGFFLSIPDIFTVLRGCPGALTPELKEGDACISDGECPDGDYCRKPKNQCPGTCTAYSAVGQPCDVNGYTCGPNLFCKNNNVCGPPDMAGKPCSTANDCTNVICIGTDASYCDLNLWCDTSTMKCAPGGGVGAPCGGTDAGTAFCAGNLWCNEISSTGTCQASGGVGAPCNILGGCTTGLYCAGFVPGVKLGQCAPVEANGSSCMGQSDCAAGLFCKFNAQGTMGTCSPPSGPGGACSGADTDCQTGLTCSKDICEPMLYPPDSCSDAGGVCEESLCKSGVCVNYAKVGEACSANGDCFLGACIGGTCADTTVCANPDAGL